MTIEPVTTMLLLAAAGIAANILTYPSRLLRSALSLMLFAAMAALNVLLYGAVGSVLRLPFQFMGQAPSFAVTPLSFYFSVMITGITLLTVIFSLPSPNGEGRSRSYYLWLFLKTFGMMGVIFAYDFLTFFFLWELMTWGTFFLMQQSGGRSAEPALKYLVYAVASSMLIFLAVALLYGVFDSFAFSEIAAGFGTLPGGLMLFIILALLIGFAVESAVFPLHSWLPDSYASTFSSLTSYLSGISTRMGIYGMLLLLFGIVGLQTMDRFVVAGPINLRYVVNVFGALTIIIPTFTALFQHDAKKLVTWHGIGQGGYMVVGIFSGSVLGIAGGMFHIFNHLTYVTVILFSIAAVEYRTGTTNLNRLGGLIKRMPVAYLGLLFGIIGLAGIPPMNGFVSKWFIYKALIGEGYPFLAIAAVIGTLGTILSVYKLIHNVFLGQLPPEYADVKAAPFAMALPIVVLMLAVFGFGVFPGPVLSLMAQIQVFFGLSPVPYTLTGIAPEAGSLNMLVITSVFMGGLAAAWIVYLLGHRRRHVSQYNNYAAGHFLDPSIPYNFNYNFYSGFEHIFNPMKKKIIARTERAVGDLVESAGDYLRRIYTGNLSTYGIYVLLSVVILTFVLKELV
jgi:formate hydrogenlyase subunit 3/multisubunit Na+/H+ antiporter MnhD subunit